MQDRLALLAMFPKNLFVISNSSYIVSTHAETPIIHSSENSLWYFKVAITFKDEHLALNYSIVDPYKKQLFPGQESYSKAEQHRLNH